RPCGCTPQLARGRSGSRQSGRPQSPSASPACRIDVDPHRQAAARIVWQHGGIRASTILVRDTGAGDTGLPLIHRLATAAFLLIPPATAGVAVVQTIARDCPDRRTGGSSDHTSVAFADLRAEQPAGHAADDGTDQ